MTLRMRFLALLAIVAGLSCGAPVIADDQADLVAAVAQGVKLRQEGKLAEAAAQLEKAARLAPGVYGDNNGNTALVLVILATVYEEQGRCTDAVPHCKRALAILEKAFGKDHLGVTTPLNNLANLYVKLSKYADAEALFRRCIAITEKDLGKDSPEVARVLNNLARLYDEQGRYSDSEPLYQRAVAVYEKARGKDHPEYAFAIHNLALLYAHQGKFAEAEPLFERALSIRENAGGPGNPVVASSVNALALLYQKQGRYADAEPLYLRAIAIYEKALGRDHPELVIPLNNMGTLYQEQARYADAEPLFYRALAINEKAFGKDHLTATFPLSCLGRLYDEQGRHADAEPLLRRALMIREAFLGKDHPEVSTALNNLALLYQHQGKFAEAEPLFRRAIAINEMAFGPEHRSVAASLNNLATLYQEQAKYAEAEPLYRRALEIDETAFGKDHPAVAPAINNLAVLYQAQGKYGEARPLLRRALDIVEKAFGKDHPYVANSLNNLAMGYQMQGGYGEAERLLRRAVAIHEKAMGPGHPSVARTLENLTLLYKDQGKYAEALDTMDRSRRSARISLVRELPSLSAQEQKRFLELAERSGYILCLSLGYRRRDDAAFAAASAGWLANGKAIATEALTIRASLEREVADPDGRKALDEIRSLRSQEAALALKTNTAERRQRLEDRRRELEKGLALRSSTAAKVATPWVELDAVRKAIPADGVLIDIARFRPHRLIFKKGEKEYDEAERYVAWVVPPSGAIRVIDLGEAGPIDEAVSAANGHIKEASRRLFDQKTGGQVVKGAEDEEKVEAETAVKLAAVARLVFDPLRAAVGDARKLILSPDGDLWLLPWAALPVGKGRYLVEDYSVRLVVSGRDLVEPARVGAAVRPAAAVIVADPDYDRPPAGGARLVNRRCAGTIGDWKVVFAFGPAGVQIIDQAEGYVAGEGTWAADGDRLTLRTKLAVYTGEFADGGYAGEQVKTENGVTSKSRWAFRVPAGDPASRGLSQDADRIPRAPRLPGTVAEARLAEAKLKQATHADPRVYAQAAATKTQVQGTKSPEVLALMTHGYFLPRQEVELRDEPRAADVGGGRAAPVPKDKSGREVENPLLRCGLLFAGANRRGEAGGGDNGVLTGQEVVSLDLRGTKLVVLSACETAVGESQTGEGVAGLRQAFQLAGAEGVLATLWQIDDEATARLMGPFYDRLAGSADRAEALTQAQRQFLQDRRKRYGAAHPYFWAAFTMTGR